MNEVILLALGRAIGLDVAPTRWRSLSDLALYARDKHFDRLAQLERL